MKNQDKDSWCHRKRCNKKVTYARTKYVLKLHIGDEMQNDENA